MTAPVAASDPSRDPSTGSDRVPDEVLGVAVAVPGPASGTGAAGRWALSIPAARQPRTGLALTAWVRWGAPIPGATDDPPGIPLDLPADAAAPLIAVHLTRQEARRTRVDVVLGAERFHATVPLDAAAAPLPAAGPALDPGTWHHLTVLWDGPRRAARLLLDGELLVEHATTVDHLPFRRTARLEIGKAQRGSRRLLLGAVRLHDRLRPPAELTGERLADLAAHPTVDESAPLAFRLSDAADEPTLSITDDDAPGRALHVVLENRSVFPVALPAPDVPRERRLELRFRPGALAGEAHHWVDPGSPRWRVEPVERADGGVSVFLAPAVPTTLAPGRTVAVTLDHVRAAGDAGSHGTHVELCYPHPHHPALRSARVSVARIVGRRGRRSSPLRFGVIGDPTVLNDGVTRNALRLFVANSSAARTVTLRAPVDGVGTALVLSADAGGPDDPWALATADQLLDAQVSTVPADWRIEVDTQDGSPQWILTPARDHELGPSDSVEIRVEDLQSGPGPAGRSRLGLRCENLPGYWDDDRAVEVEKSLVGRDRDGAALRVHGPIHDRHGELLPPGTIVMWHGSAADVPPGWLLCDGLDGVTPDLTGRFVRGRGPDEQAPRTGGTDEVTLTVAHLPAHRHDIGDHTHPVSTLTPREHPFVDGSQPIVLTAGTLTVPLRPRTVPGYAPRSGGAPGEGVSPVVVTGLDDHRSLPTGPPSAAVVDTTGGGAAVDVRPAFYELCYIMKRPHPQPPGGPR